MNEYHKIQTVFKRDMERKGKTLLEGQWTHPEFEYLAENIWVFTEKVDGTNIRVMLQGSVITFGGKTDSAQIPAQLVTRLNERFLPLADRLQEVFGCDACLYGEGYGARIQKGGGNYRQDQDFVLFDVKVGDWWLQRADVEDVAGKLGLDVVPIIGEGTLHNAIASAKERCTMPLLRRRQGLLRRGASFRPRGLWLGRKRNSRPATDTGLSPRSNAATLGHNMELRGATATLIAERPSRMQS